MPCDNESPSQSFRPPQPTGQATLRWLKDEGRFEGFMLSGRQAREAVKREQKRQARRIKKLGRTKFFPALHLGALAEGREKGWRRRWLSWHL